jgi:hypothetical protein
MKECANIGSDWGGGGKQLFYCNLPTCRSRADECSGCSGCSYCLILCRRSRLVVTYTYGSLKVAFMDGTLDCSKLWATS